jgi:predicted histidine transporter YuiF (NhaC family)
MATQTTTKSGGVSFAGLLFLLFLGLKLTNQIDWSWWWVTAPLWAPLALVLGFALIVIIIAVLIAGVALLLGKKVNLKEGLKMRFNNSIKNHK